VADSNAHLHADLIFGLPGETLESFAIGFDRLYALKPHEIQLGLLKRLRGTAIARHTHEHGMVYDARPPYTIQQTGVVDAVTMQRFTRFARYWDRIANSGRFRRTLQLWLGEREQTQTGGGCGPSPFYAFLGFSDWLWESTEKTSGLSPESLVDSLFEYLHEIDSLPAQAVRNTLLADYVASGARSNPESLLGLLPKQGPPMRQARMLAQRQERHWTAQKIDDPAEARKQ
jgi:hypothetical protein